MLNRFEPALLKIQATPLHAHYRNTSLAHRYLV